MLTTCMQLCVEGMACSNVIYYCTSIACMLTLLPVCTLRMCSVGGGCVIAQRQCLPQVHIVHSITYTQTCPAI